jgi:hypothetical protein
VARDGRKVGHAAHIAVVVQLQAGRGRGEEGGRVRAGLGAANPGPAPM